MDFRLHPRAPLILTLWFSLPGLVLCPFIFWQSFWGGVVFALVWGGLALFLGVSIGSTMQGSARMGQLHIGCGILFKLTWRMPLRFITGFTRIETPLLHLFRCCTLVVHSSGRLLVLPAIREAQAIQLEAYLQQEDGL